MLLKKQTVWLLTMLSLVVVLSVYYITSPEQQQNVLAAVDQEEENDHSVETVDLTGRSRPASTLCPFRSSPRSVRRG